MTYTGAWSTSNGTRGQIRDTNKANLARDLRAIVRGNLTSSHDFGKWAVYADTDWDNPVEHGVVRW